MNKIHYTLIVKLLTPLTLSVHSQTDLAFELQLYPTGIIPGISIDHSLSEKSVLYGRLGANLFDHRDLGVQKDEKGSGFGLSLGYKSYFKDNNRKAWRWGIKNDIWRNSVDWDNDTEKGNTKIIVLQPTGELSYVFRKNKFFIAPSVALGFEWNLKTEGKATGEGAILLIGVQIGGSLK